MPHTPRKSSMSILAALTLSICSLCNRTIDDGSNRTPDVTIYLQYFDMLSKYARFPTDDLGSSTMVCVRAVIVTLCRVVNVEGTAAWLVLRNYLQSDMGHAFFGTLLDLLESPANILQGLCDPEVKLASASPPLSMSSISDVPESGFVANAYCLPIYQHAQEASVLPGAGGITTLVVNLAVHLDALQRLKVACIYLTVFHPSPIHLCIVNVDISVNLSLVCRQPKDTYQSSAWWQSETFVEVCSVVPFSLWV